ncbi:hypothetical protein WA158_004492 [Blastocystis sp. Blastoise]
MEQTPIIPSPDSIKPRADLDLSVGTLIPNSLYIYGSQCGQCNSCNGPCLHPLATADLTLFFQDYNLKLVDWINDKSCLIRFDDENLLRNALLNNFIPAYKNSNEVEWYESTRPVIKQIVSDTYGEKGKYVFLFCRLAYTTDKPKTNNKKPNKKHVKKLDPKIEMALEEINGMDSVRNLSRNAERIQRMRGKQKQGKKQNQSKNNKNSMISEETNRTIASKKKISNNKKVSTVQYKRESQDKVASVVQSIGHQLTSEYGTSLFSFNMFGSSQPLAF